jgi:hypothetical protein
VKPDLRPFPEFAMDLLVAPVHHIEFDIEVALTTQVSVVVQ